MNTNRDIYEAIQQVRDLLSDETKWLKGMFACNEKGEICFIDDPEACKWCLSGALAKICKSTTLYTITNRFLINVLNSVGFNSIGSFNDNENTRHETVIDFLNMAISKCETERR